MASKNLTTENVALNLIVNGNQAQSEFAQLGRVIKDAKSEIKALTSEMKAMEAEGKAGGESYKDLAKQMKVAERALESSKVKQKELLQNIKLEHRTVEQLKQSIRSLKAVRDKATPNSEAYKSLNNELARTRDRLNEIQNGGTKTGSVITELTGRFGFLTSGVAAGVAAITQLYNSNLRMEPVNQALRVGSGDAENFARNMEFLRNTSARLGLEFISTATAFKQWQGAAKFSNLTAQETRDIFESVANAGAKMKLSNEQVEGTFLALSQMLSKGKVQAEELRGQLGERLPGAFALAAKAMGVTEQELNKMLEKGEVVADEFLPRFAKQLDISFGADKTEKIEGMQASANRLSNEFDALWQSEKASSFFTVVTDGLASMLSGLNKVVNSKSFKEFYLRAASVGSALMGNSLASSFFGERADLKRSRDNQRNFTSSGIPNSPFATGNDSYKSPVDTLFPSSYEYKGAAATEKPKKEKTKEELEKEKKERDKARREAIREQSQAYRNELESAEKYHQDRLIREGFFRQDFADLTKEQLEELAGYELEYQSKIDGIQKKYGEKLKTVTQTAQTELDKRKKDEEKYIQEVINSQKSLTEQENIEYNERLKKAGLFGVDRQAMTDQQLQALEALEKEHQLKIDKIEDDAIKVDFDQKQKAFDKEIAAVRVKHNNELADITNLDKAKEYLRSSFSDKELKQIRSLDQARKLIQNQQFIAEEKLTKDHLLNLASLLQQAIATGSFGDMILSEEQKEKLKDSLLEIETIVSKMFTIDKGDGLKDKDPNAKMDVLGMTVEDWETMFKNLKTGTLELEHLYGALSAMTTMWGEYNKITANIENAQLQKDEAANNKKKENLQKRLDQGAISQESYNKQIDRLDKQLEKKKAKVARDQAKRDRNVALMSSIVNTATGITKVLASPGGIPGIILSALIGAMGALQIGTIASTPLPEIPGAESGGQFLQVIREQDGKKFNAKADPKKRGYVSNPTVLVGENGKEWVANAQAVENPTVKPIIDVLDTAQRNGTINTLNLSDIIAGSVLGRSMPGRQSGGSFSSGPSTTTVYDPQMVKVLSSLGDKIEKLDSRLSNLKADVSLLGKNGFVEKMDELNNIQKTANL